MTKWVDNQERLKEWFKTCKINNDIPVNIYDWFDLKELKGSVLDIGAGHPKGTWFIDKFDNYTGIDSMPYDDRIIKAMAENLPFKDKSFDYVFCMSVLQHCLDPEKTVQEIKRVCRKQAFISVYCSKPNDLILHEFDKYKVIELFKDFDINNIDVIKDVVYLMVKL